MPQPDDQSPPETLRETPGSAASAASSPAAADPANTIPAIDWRTCPSWCGSTEHTVFGTDDDGRVMLNHCGQPWHDPLWAHVVYYQDDGAEVDRSIELVGLDEVVYRDADPLALIAQHAQVTAAWLRGDAAVETEARAPAVETATDQATTPTNSTRGLGRGIDRNPGTDLHGGQRPCLVYAWCDTVHDTEHGHQGVDDDEPERHEAVADAAGTIRLDGGLTLPVRLVDIFDDGDLAIRLELEHGVADDLSDLRTLATVPLELTHARELAYRLDLVLDGEPTHRDDAPIWLTVLGVSLAVQREAAWDQRHRRSRTPSSTDVVHLQLTDDEGRTLVDLPVPLGDVPGLVANLGQLLGYAALSHPDTEASR